MNAGRRAAVVFVVVAAIAAGVVTDHLVGRSLPAGATQGAGPGLPSAAPAGALSSTWFCPAASSIDNGLADGRIVVGNPTAADLTGTMTIVPSQGASQTVPLSVRAHSRLSVRPGDTVRSPYAAATIQLDGAAGAVEQQIRGALGESTTPCATHASDRWYFAAGNTDRDTQLLLSLFNPFPGDAVVDLDFATDIGRARPADLQGLVVPGQGLVVIDVGAHVRRRQAVSTTIAVRSGRIVADKMQIVGLPAAPLAPAGNGRAPLAPAGPRGVTLTLGVPAVGASWFFPDGITAPGVVERYEIYNPGDIEADISLLLKLDRGDADPFNLTVPAHDRLTLTVNGESRIPPTVGHAGVIQSTNGSGVVVERVITSGPPSPHLGISDITGAPVAASRWVFPAGAADKVQDEWLVAFNPGQAPARLSVTGFVGSDSPPVAIDGLQGLEIAPGERIAVRLGDHLAQGSLMLGVDATAPLVVERVLYRIRALGMSASLGVPGPPT